MARATAIGDAQDGLAAALEALALVDAAGNAVPVHLGVPPRGGTREAVWVAGEATDWTQAWNTTGDLNTAARQELFTCAVHFLALKLGDDYKLPRDRALEMAAAFSDQLRIDDTLGGRVEHAEHGGGELSHAAIDNTTYAAVTVLVRCRAYLA